MPDGSLRRVVHQRSVCDQRQNGCKRVVILFIAQLADDIIVASEAAHALAEADTEVSITAGIALVTAHAFKFSSMLSDNAHKRVKHNCV